MQLSYHACICLSRRAIPKPSPEFASWKESIAAEPHTLGVKCKCWEVVPSSQHGEHNLLRCHIVFKVKMKAGLMNKYKSRLLVVDGSKQVAGSDYIYE